MRIGDMRAVMIEGPSREAKEPIDLGSCAYVNQLTNTQERDAFGLSSFGPSNRGFH